MLMLFLNLITIKLCILHKYHLPPCCGSAGICHSTCLEMPRIAKVRTYFWKKKLSGGGPPDRSFNTTFSFFVTPSPLFGAKLRHWYIQISPDLNDTPYYYIIWIYKRYFPHENQHQTLKKIDRGQIRLREYLLRGPGIDSRLISPLRSQRLVISCFHFTIWLKYHQSDVNPQNNKPGWNIIDKYKGYKNTNFSRFLHTSRIWLFSAWHVP